MTMFWWVGTFLAPVGVACPPGTASRGYPMLLSVKCPGEGRGLAPQLLSDLQGKSFQTSWPPPLRARLHHNPESETSSGEGKDLPAWPGGSPFPGGQSQPTRPQSCGPRAGARRQAGRWTQASGTAAGLLGPSHQPHHIPGSCSLLSQLTSLEPDRLGGEGALQAASSWHERQS